MAAKEKEWENDFRRIVAENVKRLRKRIDVTADRLAELTGPEGTGLTGGYIRQLETGNTWVSDKSLGLLAKGLGAKPGELLIDLTADLKPTPEEALAIVSEALRSRSAPVHKPEVPAEIEAFIPLLSGLTEDGRKAAMQVLSVWASSKSGRAAKVG